MTCAISWPAFGLQDPGDIGCIEDPILGISQACVHEHMAYAQVCGPCLAEFVSYDDPDDWTCGPCVLVGHNCPAPLKIHALPENRPYPR